MTSQDRLDGPGRGEMRLVRNADQLERVGSAAEGDDGAGGGTGRPDRDLDRGDVQNHSVHLLSAWCSQDRWRAYESSVGRGNRISGTPTAVGDDAGMLPMFEAGRGIVVEERWRGRLWSAVPHRVVESEQEMLITQVAAGTRGVFATNRGLPEAAGMTRDERKHEALKTCVARPVEAEEPLDLVHVCQPGRWARVILGWKDDHEFRGWYVNFELPVKATESGVWGKDLVLDLMIFPDGSWSWKDSEEFDRALDDGIFAPELKSILVEESDRVLEDHSRRRGPFDPELLTLRPGPASTATLPSEYGPAGERWQRSYPVEPILPYSS